MPNKEYGPLEKDIAEAFSYEVGFPSPTIDTFSIWLLGGASVAIALFIYNVDILSSRIGAAPSNLLLMVIGISVIFGFLQKLFLPFKFSTRNNLP